MIKRLEIAETTYHRWGNQYGGMKADDVKRLKDLEGVTMLAWILKVS